MYRIFFNHFELADMFNNLPQKFNHSTITLCIIVLSFRYILLYIVIVSYVFEIRIRWWLIYIHHFDSCSSFPESYVCLNIIRFFWFQFLNQFNWFKNVVGWLQCDEVYTINYIFVWPKLWWLTLKNIKELLTFNFFLKHHNYSSFLVYFS